MMAEIVVPARFNGPPGSGNGGYVAGLLASRVGGTAEVTLAAPPPLDTPLRVEWTGELVMARTSGERVIATARPATLALDPPAPPPPDEVDAMSRRYRGFEDHPFSTCFVCGPARAPGDGLRIFAGRRPGDALVAAPWIVDASVANDEDEVSLPAVWAAIDCPGYFAFGAPSDAAMLGRMTADVAARPAIDERCTVVAWSIGTEGRKRFAGTALYGGDGRLLARARQVWIDVAPPVVATG